MCVVAARGWHLVPRAGFEPATCRLGGGCSIQLSYRGAARMLANRDVSRHVDRALIAEAFFSPVLQCWSCVSAMRADDRERQSAQTSRR